MVKERINQVVVSKRSSGAYTTSTLLTAIANYGRECLVGGKEGSLATAP